MGNSNGKPVVFTDEGKPLPSITQSSLPAPCLEPISRNSGTTLAKTWALRIQDFSLTLVFHTVNLNHFRLLRVVGKGAFGKVRIVERKDTGLTFALKYIRKDEGGDICTSENDIGGYRRLICCAVVRSESVRNIIRERRMLEHLNHPFLCNLRYSFQDIEYL